MKKLDPTPFRPQTWDVLQQVIDNWTYVDGMRSPEFWRDDEHNYAELHVFLHNPNSYGGEPGNRPDRHTRHIRLVPCATFNYESWRRWLYEFICDIAIHEVGEWFMDRGERIFAPHHGNGEDPYAMHETIVDRSERIAKAPGED
jgi:hypothetical protein